MKWESAYKPGQTGSGEALPRPGLRAHMDVRTGAGSNTCCLDMDVKKSGSRPVSRVLSYPTPLRA